MKKITLLFLLSFYSLLGQTEHQHSLDTIFDDLEKTAQAMG